MIVLASSRGTLVFESLASAFLASGIVYFASAKLVSDRLQKADGLIAEIQDTGPDPLFEAERGDEIDQLMERINSVNDSVKDNLSTLRRMESYRKDFLGDISHELKTPIFAVRGFAETLIDGAVDDPEVRISFLEKIIQNADRLGSLAEDLNAITSIETGELKMEMTPFNIGSTVKDVVSQLEPMAAGENVKLSFKIGPVERPVFGDPVRIHQVIRNLAENAIKYTGSGGFTEIVVRQIEASSVRVSVIDSGIGISPENIVRITERFFRVERSRARGLGGTGLGLAIVKHILAAHDQKLKVESSVGVGSTFAFDLTFASASE
ncbi:MAG: histidine kinase [Rhodothermales bacterium]|nr:histidine kinase [Rhodothermales bacterium]